jgi:hypothetical protein
LSRHQAGTLEATRPASEPGPATGPNGIPGSGSRSGRRKKGFLRRTGIVLPAAAIAAVIVAVVTIAVYVVSPNGSGANSLAQAINALPQNHSIALLEQERQQIIVMNEAASTMTIDAKPVVVSPSKVEAAAAAAADNAATSQDTVAPPPVDPGTAQQIAYNLLPSFGFSQSGQWGCLDDLWQQESSWEWDAENPSGAYGIPQSLPASKMASAGPDYLTDPTTQIEWGLGYITDVYGTPCAAWDHEEADGWY